MDPDFMIVFTSSAPGKVNGLFSRRLSIELEELEKRNYEEDLENGGGGGVHFDSLEDTDFSDDEGDTTTNSLEYEYTFDEASSDEEEGAPEFIVSSSPNKEPIFLVKSAMHSSIFDIVNSQEDEGHEELTDSSDQLSDPFQGGGAIIDDEADLFSNGLFLEHILRRASQSPEPEKELIVVQEEDEQSESHDQGSFSFDVFSSSIFQRDMTAEEKARLDEHNRLMAEEKNRVRAVIDEANRKWNEAMSAEQPESVIEALNLNVSKCISSKSDVII